MRNKDERRKLRRQAAKQRKKEEKVKQMEGLKRAKNLKKQEIFNKLKQIQEITGNKSMCVRHLSHVNLIHIFKRCSPNNDLYTRTSLLVSCWF